MAKRLLRKGGGIILMVGGRRDSAPGFAGFSLKETRELSLPFGMGERRLILLGRD
jgi:hypothetical protein